MIVIIEPEIEIIEIDGSDEIQIIEIGIAGPPGKPGLNGDGGIEIPFAYGDATPVDLYLVDPDKLIYTVVIVIQEIFDGDGAQLTVGDNGNPSRLMMADQNNPSDIGQYQATPIISYGEQNQLRLYITPGLGATQGKGVVRMFIQQ